MSRQRVNIIVEGEHLDLFNDEKIVLKKQIKSSKDISKVFTDFSHSFKIPVTKRNNRVFKHAFRKDSADFDVRGFYSSVIEVNGEDYSRGYIELLKSEHRNGKAVAYHVRHFGRLLTLSRIIGDRTLNDIRGVYSKYDFPQNEQVFYDLATTNATGTLPNKTQSYWTDYDADLVEDNVRIFLNNDTEQGWKYNNSTTASDFTDLYTENETNVAYTTHTTATTGQAESTRRGINYNGIVANRMKASLKETAVLSGIEEYFQPSGLQFSRGLDANGYPTATQGSVQTGQEHFFGSTEFDSTWMLFYNKETGGSQGRRTLHFENDWTRGIVEDNGVRPHRGNNCFEENDFNDVYAPVSPYRLRDNAYSDYYVEVDLTVDDTTIPWEFYILFKGEQVAVYRQTGNLDWTTSTFLNTFTAANTRTIQGVKVLTGATRDADCGFLSFEVRSEDPLQVTGDINVHKLWEKREGLWQSGRRYYRTFTMSNTIDDADTDADNYTLQTNAPGIKIMDYLRGLQKTYNLIWTVEKDASNNDIIVAKTYDNYYSGNVIDLTNETDTLTYSVEKPQYYTQVNFDYNSTNTFQTEEFNNVQPVPYGSLEHEVTLDNRFLVPSKEFKVDNPFDMVLLNNPSNDNSTSETPIFVYAWLVDNSYSPTEIGTFRHYGSYSSVGSGSDGLLMKSAANVAFSEVSNANLVRKFRYSGTDIAQTLLYSTNTEEELSLSGADQETPSLYNTYWQTTISDLFDRFAKTHKFSAKLSRGSIKNLTLDKTVLISDNPYRINNYEVDLLSGRANLDLVSLNQPEPVISFRDDYESGYAVNSIHLGVITSNVGFSVASNASLTLSIVATGGNSTLTYQWYRNSTAVSGATSATFTPTTFADDDTFFVRVTDGTYTVDSLVATLSVTNVSSSNITAFTAYDTSSPVAGETASFTFTAAIGTNYEVQLVNQTPAGWADNLTISSSSGTTTTASTTFTITVPANTGTARSFVVRVQNTDIEDNFIQGNLANAKTAVAHTQSGFAYLITESEDFLITEGGDNIVVT